jgi:hypothetical protein
MLVVALLLGVSGLGSALAGGHRSETLVGDVKPVAVVSLAGYDALLGNVELAGILAGRPKLAKGLEGLLAVVTQGRGLEGLDTKRPWGVVIQTDGSKLGGYAFLPVGDFEKFKEVVKPYIQKVEDLGDGLHKVQGKGPRQVIYVKQNSGWMFVCDNPQGLAQTPDDPAKLLDGLQEQYDLAVRLNVSNVPAEQREQLITKIQQQAEKDLQRRGALWAGEDEQEYAIRKIVAGKILAAVLTMVKDLETVTLGWSLDDEAQKVLLEMALTAKDGTKTAYTLAQLAKVKTDFAGFRLPGAIVTGSVAAVYPQPSSADLDELFGAVRAKAFGDIDARESSAERAKVGKELVGGLLEVIQETVASGRADGAVSLLLSADAATLVAGRYIAGGPKLEETLNKLVEAARQEDPALVDQVLKRDVGELRGVRFHSLTIPVPQDAQNRDRVVQLVGESLEIVVGIGKQSVYLAAGKDALETLKKAVEQSAAGGPQPATPLELSLALGQLAKFLAETGQGEQKQRALKAVEALEGAAGKDHVKLVAVPIERGLKLRLELEQGVLKIIRSIPQQPGKRLSVISSRD